MSDVPQDGGDVGLVDEVGGDEVMLNMW